MLRSIQKLGSRDFSAAGCGGGDALLHARVVQQSATQLRRDVGLSICLRTVAIRVQKCQQSLRGHGARPMEVCGAEQMHQRCMLVGALTRRRNCSNGEGRRRGRGWGRHVVCPTRRV